MGVPGKSLRSRQVTSEILCVPHHRQELALVKRNFPLEASPSLNLQLNPQISPSNTINTCHEEGKEIESTVEGRQPGQDSPAGLEWRRAVHVIVLRAVIFF